MRKRIRDTTGNFTSSIRPGAVNLHEHLVRDVKLKQIFKEIGLKSLGSHRLIGIGFMEMEKDLCVNDGVDLLVRYGDMKQIRFAIALDRQAPLRQPSSGRLRRFLAQWNKTELRPHVVCWIVATTVQLDDANIMLSGDILEPIDE